jgi:hypothetical protein
MHSGLDTLAYIAYALASAVVVYFALMRLGHRYLAGACMVIMFVLKFAAIHYLDLEGPGEPSTYRASGEVLPAWLAWLGVFNQFGAWGAFGAALSLARRKTAKASADTPASDA